MTLKKGVPAVGEVVANKYRIDGIIGEGGMGAVLSAIHQITQKRVALKWMHGDLSEDRDAVQRFIREAQAAGRIDHPNVVVIFDVEKHENTVFLVMEYLHGEPLTALLTRRRLEIAEVIQILLPALRGVAAAHRHGIIHRDIKPDNIFLCRSPDGKPREAKVLDFGISKFTAGEGALSLSLTQTGAMIGTPFYMSPERVRGRKEIGPQADIYAFGVILYEALSGQRPFEAETLSALVLEIATGTPRRLQELRPELPSQLEAVVTKAMAREPEDRYADIDSLIRALEPFGGGAYFDLSQPESDVSYKTTLAAQSLSGTSTPFSAETAFLDTTERGAWNKKRLTLLTIAGLALVFLMGAAFGVWKFYKNSLALEQDAPIVRPAVTQPDTTIQSKGFTPSRVPAAKSSIDESKPVETAGSVVNAPQQDVQKLSGQREPPTNTQRVQKHEIPKTDIRKKPATRRSVRANKHRDARSDRQNRPAPEIEKEPILLPQKDDEKKPQPQSTPPVTSPRPSRAGELELDDF